MDRIESFEPICGDKPKVLILGTMPSVKSLERQEYYGFGRNQFWRIMGQFFGFDRDDDYEYRKTVVARKGIAVWDVLRSCERKGSLDKDIKNEIHNDIVGFVKSHPSITHVILNGGKARDVFHRHFKGQLPEIEAVTFYSTSPANAIAYDKKLKQWRQLLGWLGDNITLIGMPGAGKSTIGVVLAKTLGMRFLDTDLLIQEREGRLLQNIIDNEGMQAFINAEESAVCSVKGSGMVIATGGSVVYSEKAMTHLGTYSKVVYLDVAFEEIERRINNITTRGIAIREGASLKDVYEERRQLYERYSDHTIDCNGKTVEEVIREVCTC